MNLLTTRYRITPRKHNQSTGITLVREHLLFGRVPIWRSQVQRNEFPGWAMQVANMLSK